MPTISIPRDLLHKELGKPFSEAEFDEVCFSYGIELDDVVEEDDPHAETPGAKRVVYKIDMPANRYDLLCLEGLGRALRVFFGEAPPPAFKVAPPTTKVTVHGATRKVRPYVVCAILRNIAFTPASYQSFLDLQEQLHRNLCRRRTLVAIGTHDLDSIQLPVRYDAKPPSDIVFRHLFASPETAPKNARAVLDEFRSDPERSHLKEYTDIIYNAEVYPVVLDARNEVLSLPPVINGAYSKMSASTRNVFIECTATDLTKANVVLNTMVTMFARYCATPDVVEAVEVDYVDGFPSTAAESVAAYKLTPDLSPRDAAVKVADINAVLGLKLSSADVCGLLSKMQMVANAVAADGDDAIVVKVPPTRADILHAVDLIEDTAIAYGFNKLPEALPVSHRPGKELPVNTLSDMLRVELACAGLTEILTFGLCSRLANFEWLGREDDGKTAVSLANPKTLEYQVARTTLLPGLLKTLEEHRAEQTAQGLKIFEVSEVVLLDPSQDTGARNSRRLAAMYAGPTAGLEIVHGIMDRVMQLLNVVPSTDYSPDAHEEANRLRSKNATFAGTYTLVPFSGRNSVASGAGPKTYLPGKSAAIMWTPPPQSSLSTPSQSQVEIGTMGIIHPDVLKHSKVSNPVSAFEITLDAFVELA